MAEFQQNQPAFRDLTVNKDGSVSVWIACSLRFPFLSVFKNHQSRNLANFAEVEDNATSYSCEECSIKTAKSSDENGIGHLVTFQESILHSAGHALIDTPNKAVAKIGYELINLSRKQRSFAGDSEVSNSSVSNSSPEIKEEEKSYFLNGANTISRSATITFKHSALVELGRLIRSDHPFSHLFTNLAEVVDPEAEHVDEDLDEITGAMDETLLLLQSSN